MPQRTPLFVTCKNKSFFLQLLKTEAGKMLVLVSRAFPEDRGKQSPLASHRERELSLQVHLAATGIQVSWREEPVAQEGCWTSLLGTMRSPTRSGDAASCAGTLVLAGPQGCLKVGSGLHRLKSQLFGGGRNSLVASLIRSPCLIGAAAVAEGPCRPSGSASLSYLWAKGLQR